MREKTYSFFLGPLNCPFEFPLPVIKDSPTFKNSSIRIEFQHGSCVPQWVKFPNPPDHLLPVSQIQSILLNKLYLNKPN